MHDRVWGFKFQTFSSGQCPTVRLSGICNDCLYSAERWKLSNEINNCREHCPSWEAYNSSGSQVYSLHFLEPESSLSSRKIPPIAPIVSRLILHLQEPFYITDPFTLYFQKVSVTQISQPKPFMLLSVLPQTCHMPCLLFQVWSPEKYLVGNRDQEASNYATPSQALIPSIT